MSKTILLKRVEQLEQKKSPDKIVLVMWCPGGETPPNPRGRLQIKPSNPEDRQL